MCGIFGHFSNKFTQDIQEKNNKIFSNYYKKKKVLRKLKDIGFFL